MAGGGCCQRFIRSIAGEYSEEPKISNDWNITITGIPHGSPVQIHLHCDECVLLEAISDKLDTLIDQSGDKEKMLELAKELNAKREELKGAIPAQNT